MKIRKREGGLVELSDYNAEVWIQNNIHETTSAVVTIVNKQIVLILLNLCHGDIEAEIEGTPKELSILYDKLMS